MSVADVEFLEGHGYVEPAKAGGSGGAVSIGFSDDFPPSPSERVGRVFCLGQVAQLVEHMTENHGVGSSILPLAIFVRGRS